MNSPYTVSMTSTCLICDRHLSGAFRARNKQPLDAQQIRELVCDDAHCRAAYQSQLQQCRKMCAICQRPLTVHQEVRGDVCGHQQCQVEYLSQRLVSYTPEEKERHLREVVACEEERLSEIRQTAQVLRDRSAASFGVDDPHSYTVVIVPSNTRRITNLPERRKRAFRDHLTRLISKAAERHHASPSVISEEKSIQNPTDHVDQHQPQELSHHACAVCKGECCSHGGNHAFLSIHLLCNYLERQPQFRPSDVIEKYLLRLPEKTYSESCVYHAQDGCALPRDMRSNTCNEYACAGLHEYQTAVLESDRRQAFVAACGSMRIDHSTFISAEDFRNSVKHTCGRQRPPFNQTIHTTAE